MTQNKRIAITGGLGSGKSTVLNCLRQKGYPVFSCDEIYAELCLTPRFLRGLDKLFPGCVKKGVLDRKTLSERVFSDESARKTLNAFSHPLVLEKLNELTKELPLSFAEVPLLFESGSETLFDGTIVVMRDKRARIEAVKIRNGLSEEEIARRMARQYDYDKTPPKNCFLLENNGSILELNSNLDEILAKIV